MRMRMFVLGLALLLAGCSLGQEQPLLTEQTKITRDKAILVMGIAWQDSFNDPKTGELKLVTSQEVASNPDYRANHVRDLALGLFYDPLYHLGNFRFVFSDGQGNDQVLLRFHLEALGYEPIALHAFTPGKTTLARLVLDDFRFPDGGPDRSNPGQTSKPYFVVHELGQASWEIPPGKVVYLGDLLLRFETKKGTYGLFTEQVIVEKSQLQSYRLSNRFAETKAALLEQKPWFPASEMVDLSQTGEWEIKPSWYRAPSSTPQQTKDKNSFY